MTAIAYRDGVMAADTAIWSGTMLRGHVRKIVRGADGALAASAGLHSDCLAFHEWFLSSGTRSAGIRAFEPKAKDPDSWGGLIAHPDGSCDVYDSTGRRIIRPDAPFLVEGSSDEFMLGAMAAGAGAEEAVRLAILFTGYAAGDVQVERHFS